MKNIEDEVIILKSLTDEEVKMEMIERQQEMTLLLSKKIVWALEKNITRLEDYEEYELCEQVRKWIDYLKIEEIC